MSNISDNSSTLKSNSSNTILYKGFYYSFTNFKNKDKGFLFDVLYIKFLAHSLMIVGKTFYKKLLKFKILII